MTRFRDQRRLPRASGKSGGNETDLFYVLEATLQPDERMRDADKCKGATGNGWRHFWWSQLGWKEYCGQVQWTMLAMEREEFGEIQKDP